MARHSLEFYDNDAYFAEAIASRLRAATDAGRPCLAMLTATHRGAVELALGAHSRLITFVSTDELTEVLTAGDNIDLDAFRANVIPLLKPDALAVGDVCDTLIRKGRTAAAMALEKVFEGALEELEFEALCAYGVEGMDAAELHRLRSSHS